MGAISGAIGGGLGKVGGIFARTDFVGGRPGIAGSALSQGVGVATGLQEKFDWAGIAAAGIGGGVSGQFDKWLEAGSLADSSLRNIAANIGSSGLGGVANAATRSLLTGTSFGDNILAALPDIIGSTIGNLIGHSVESHARTSPGQAVFLDVLAAIAGPDAPTQAAVTQGG